MTGSPIFSISFNKFDKSKKSIYNLNYHMSIKKSQAILKRLDFKFSVSGLRWVHKTKPCFVTLTTFLSFLFPLSSFLFPLSSFLFPFSSFLFPLSSFLFPLSRIISVLSRKDRSDSASRVDCRSFSALTILTAVDLKKVLRPVSRVVLLPCRTQFGSN